MNVGGVRYETCLSTILKYSDTLLGRMFSERNRSMLLQDDSGEYFIDRNGRAFEPILEFYRTGEILIPPHLSAEIVQREVDYFQLPAQVLTLPFVLTGDQLPKKLQKKKVFEFMQLTWKYHRLYLRSNDGCFIVFPSHRD